LPRAGVFREYRSALLPFAAALFRPSHPAHGGVEPLEALQDPERREPVVRRIIGEYPDPAEYDSPPVGRGR
jgi:hypothetical protein